MSAHGMAANVDITGIPGGAEVRSYAMGGFGYHQADGFYDQWKYESAKLEAERLKAAFARDEQFYQPEIDALFNRLGQELVDTSKMSNPGFERHLMNNGQGAGNFQSPILGGNMQFPQQNFPILSNPSTPNYYGSGSGAYGSYNTQAQIPSFNEYDSYALYGSNYRGYSGGQAEFINYMSNGMGGVYV